MSTPSVGDLPVVADNKPPEVARPPDPRGKFLLGMGIGLTLVLLGFGGMLATVIYWGAATTAASPCPQCSPPPQPPPRELDQNNSTLIVSSIVLSGLSISIGAIFVLISGLFIPPKPGKKPREPFFGET
jgi:hypothetical protein